MKVLQKMLIVIVSSMIFLATIALLVAFSVIDLKLILMLYSFVVSNYLIQYGTIAASCLIIIIGFVIIFGTGKSRKSIILQGEAGDLIISQETIESIANNIATSFNGTKEVYSRISLNNKEDLTININMQVEPNTNISEVVQSIQLKVKEQVKNATQIEVSSVNVNVKNIYNSRKADKPA